MKRKLGILVLLTVITFICPSIGWGGCGENAIPGLNPDDNRGQKTRYAEVYGLVENFIWQEMNSGKRLLEENGNIYGIGFAGRLFYPSNETLSGIGELFTGNVGYDGAIQSGAKAVSTTDYLGLRVEADKGFYKRLTYRVSVEPYFGAGYRWWLRKLNDGKTTTGVTAKGYTEEWQTLYLRLGVREDIILGRDVKLFSRIGLSGPVFNSNSVRLSEIDPALPDITLNPGRQLSLNADAGIRINRFQLTMFYEQMRFSKSENISIGSGLYFFQPESNADIFGIRIGTEL